MTRKQIRNRTYYWQKKMGLDNWDLKVTFLPEEEDKEDYNTIASVGPDSQYKLASVNYIPKNLKHVGDVHIVHELLHVLFSPLVESARMGRKKAEKEKIAYFSEQVVSEVSRVVMRVKNVKTNTKG